MLARCLAQTVAGWLLLWNVDALSSVTTRSEESMLEICRTLDCFGTGRLQKVTTLDGSNSASISLL